MSTTDTNTLPIIVTAYVLPGKPDPSAEAHFANSDRAAGYAQMLLDSGDYCSTQIDYDGHSHILTRDPEPETVESNGQSFTVEVKQVPALGCNGLYVQVTNDLTGEVTPGVRNPTVSNVAIARAERTADRLRQAGCKVTLRLPGEPPAVPQGHGGAA